jgi:hypothetical protein
VPAYHDLLLDKWTGILLGYNKVFSIGEKGCGLGVKFCLGGSLQVQGNHVSPEKIDSSLKVFARFLQIDADKGRQRRHRMGVVYFYAGMTVGTFLGIVIMCLLAYAKGYPEFEGHRTELSRETPSKPL